VVFCEDTLAAEGHKIFVIKSRDITPYKRAYSGFKDAIENRVYNAVYKEYNFQKFEDKTVDLLKILDEEKADIVLAVGTEAAVFARRSIKNVPVVFTMVLSPVESGIVDSLKRPGGNITGVCLNIPIEAQFKVLKRMIPRIKRIGMLYDKATKSDIEREANVAAARIGVKLVSKPIYSETEISNKLNEVFREADCLWAGVDPKIYNTATAQHIILSTLNNRIPFMAFSAQFVKAGALMALECDYYDIGQQAGEITAEMLMRGIRPHNMPIRLPRKTKLVVNMKTAQNNGVDIPRELLEGAVVYGR
jgi:putative ABC transport system substrate-binding protein